MSNTATGYTISVGGDMNVTTNQPTFKMNNSTGACTLNISGNLNLSSGAFGISTGNANSVVNVNGNVTIGNCILIMHEDASATVGTLNVKGNFTMSNGTINESSGGRGLINFNGTTQQNFVKTGGTISNMIDFVVQPNAIINFGTSVLNGSTGNFTLHSGATLMTGHAQGISIAGATGSVQVTGTRTYASGANYVYTGTIAQITGLGLTQNTPNNLTINSTNTVTLSANTSISGNLLIAQGTLNTSVSNYSFTLSGNFTNNGVFVVNSSNVSFVGNTHTYINGSSATAFRNVIVNKVAPNIQVISNSKAFSASGQVQIIQGNLVLQATDDNYIFSSNVLVQTGGKLSHNVNWDTSGKLLQIGGNLDIQGQFEYTVPRSHVQMIGANKTISTGTSALSILTLQNGNISASGRVEINDNFWAMFGTSGSFNTNGNTVIAHAALLNNGGTLNVNGGSLSVTGGIHVGFAGQNGTMTVSSGTVSTDILNIGSGVNTGSYSQTGGVVTVSGTTTLSNGTMAMSFGTFNALGGADIGTGAYAVVYTQTGGVFNNTSNNVLLRNATMNISAGAIDVNGLLVGDATYPSTVNHSAGSIAVNNNNLEIRIGSVYNCSTTPYVVLRKDFVNNGTFVPAQSTVEISGSVKQTISGTSATDFYNLTVDNSFGEVAVESPVNIRGALNLQSGKILNTQIITLVTGATSTIGNSQSFIQGQLNIQKASAGASTLYFPIGVQGDWRPVELTVNHADATSYTYASKVVAESAAAKNWTLPSTVDNVSLMRYWTIHRYATSDLLTQVPSAGLVGNQQITLYYDSNDGVSDAAHLTICKGTAATGWVNIGGAGATAVAGKITSTSTPEAFTSFSDFTLGNTNEGENELPVQLSSFTAFVTPQTVQFTWVTQSEQNNDYFTLEYSIDGIQYYAITKVKGAGNSNIEHVYEYACTQPKFTGMVYVRLKQTDYDGTSQYSEILTVEIPNTNIDMFVYPNPATDYIVIQDNAQSVQSVTLYDITQTKLNIPQIDTQTYSLEHLPQGVYTLAIATESRIVWKKIIKK